MPFIKWFCRPICLVGLTMLCVVIGLAFGAHALWKAARIGDHLTNGRIAMEKGDTDVAWEEFSEAIRLDSGSVAARRERAHCSIRRDRLEEAITDLNVALPLAPDDSELYLLHRVVRRPGPVARPPRRPRPGHRRCRRGVAAQPRPGAGVLLPRLGKLQQVQR